jgi:ribosomal protein S18 acetylase RimI-like enzyme
VDARPLALADEPALRAFVAALPACHLGLRAAARREPPSRFVGAFDGGGLVAVLYAAPGPSVVVAGTEAGVAAATRAAAPREGPLRRLVGLEPEARACVAAWTAARAGGTAPILRRHLHMSVETPPSPPKPTLRLERAGVADVVSMARLQREFHEDDDPPGAEPPTEAWLESVVRARIAGGTTWFAREGGGAPVWKTDLAVDEPEGALLAGVVTARARRREGFARRGLATLVRARLERGGVVTLHVAEENRAARGAYERVGFRADAAFLVAYARAATAARP